MRRNTIRNRLAWCGMVAGVLGSGAIAQAQSTAEAPQPAEPKAPPSIEFRTADGKAEPKAGVLQLNIDNGSGTATGSVQLELVGDSGKPAPDQPAKPGEPAKPSDKVEAKGNVVFGVDSNDGAFRVINVAGANSEYWIGLQFEPVGDALRSQLQLPDDGGLVVEAVLADGPASKAGFKQYDVVLKINGQPAKDIDIINKQVAEAKDAKELNVELLRHGKAETIKVKPQKRPGDQGFAFSPKDATAAVIREWLPKDVELGAQGMLREPMRVETFHPGVMFFQDGGGELPKNLSVSISRSGDEPAKITVKKENTTWDVTEKELDKLPADVRPHVERMLGKGGDAGARMKVFTRRVAPPGAPVDAGSAPVTLAVPGGPMNRDVLIQRGVAMSAETDKRLDDMNRKLEALQRTLEDLTKRLPAGESPK